MSGTEQRPPSRMVHLGLGAFFRAHQAWYTQLANHLGDEQWGITALTGRRPDAASLLNAQQCRYTLIERGPAGDQAIDVRSIVAAGDGSDPEIYRAAIADPTTVIVTTTITEKGYLIDHDDAGLLRGDQAPRTALARLVDGLRSRQQAGAGPLAVVPCDNLTANGQHTRRLVSELAEQVEPELAEWIGDHVSFVSTMVDRITPATTEQDIADARTLVGWDDAAPVVAEPFSQWVLAGDFPAGRPAWDLVGAQVVDDVAPYEQRKLWLLNGAHSTLAYVGLARGHTTIAEAMTDPVCTELIAQVWADAAACLPFSTAEIDAATSALTTRFSNARIQHRLAQIAHDGSMKLPVRIVSVQHARRAAGLGVGDGFAPVIAAWLAHLETDAVNDPSARSVLEQLSSAPTTKEKAQAGLRLLDPALADDAQLVSAVSESYPRWA